LKKLMLLFKDTKVVERTNREVIVEGLDREL
jgi:hypothetical protein